MILTACTAIYFPAVVGPTGLVNNTSKRNYLPERMKKHAHVAWDH
jgi:hypothetical protein